MFKLKLFLFSFSFFILPALLFAADSVTITTYYPSPYGSYKDLYVSNKLGIGTTGQIVNYIDKLSNMLYTAAVC